MRTTEVNKIVTVVLKKDDISYADEAYQWNYGQILRIQGGNLPKVVEVHFSLEETSGTSVTRIGTTVDGVTEVPIPDSHLENNNCSQDYTIYAYIYLEDGTAGRTEYEIAIPVKARTKPEVPGTPKEPELFRETVKAVNDAADRAEQAKQNAKASATEAGKYAAGASESADAAKKTKEDALKEVGEKKQEAIKAIQEQEETSVGKITTHTDDEIQRILNQTAESKGELEQTITNADASKEELDESIQTAGDTKTALDKSTELAGTAKTELDTSIREAGTAKIALDESTETAGTAQETLSGTVKQAGALDTSLGEKIKAGTQLKTDLVASGEKAVQDIQEAGSEQLGNMQAVAEEFRADREQITKNKEDIGSLKEDLLYFGSIDEPGEETLVTGKMVLANGYLTSQESSDAHTGIRVTRGTRIEISNAYCAYSRSICAYDNDGNFIKTLGTNLGTEPVTVEYDVDDYDSISVTSKTGESITVRYISGQSVFPAEGYATRIDEKNATKDGTGNYIDTPRIQLDQNAFTDGYLAGKYVIDSRLYYYSDFIPVIEEQDIKLNNIFVGGFTVAVFYDSDKEYLTYIRHASTSLEISTTITVPYNAKYMRFTANKSRDFSTISVSYVDKIERNFKPLNLVNRWYYDSKCRINTLFAKATSKPICCIIDDDSPSATDMEIFAALMEENGISGTIACLTKVMDNNEDLKTKLLELERRGHQVVLHGYTQNEAYRNASVIGDENYKVAEDDFVHGLNDLMSAGFVDYKFWVTPYGVAQDCLKNLARKWGMECLITTAKKEYNGSDGKYSRYEIQRSGLNAGDTGTLTQEQLLALADQCADANGWLLINTHITDGWNGDFTRITDFITHCKEKGFEFMTLGDAWRIRKPIYEWYETF